MIKSWSDDLQGKQILAGGSTIANVYGHNTSQKESDTLSGIPTMDGDGDGDIEIHRDENMENVETQSLRPKRSSSQYSQSLFSNQTDDASRINTDCPREDEETGEERLERWKQFFNHRPLMRCLDDGDGDELLAELLFNRLYEEVRVKAIGMGGSKYRGELQARAFWDNVRGQLRVNDDEIFHAWPYTYVEHEEEHFVRGFRKFKLGSRRITRPPPYFRESAATTVSKHVFRQYWSTWLYFHVMDPFSVEGELLNLANHFYQGQWQQVIDFDISGLSPKNALPARIFSLRAQIALGHAEDVISDVQGESEPELVAVGALAEFAAGNEAKGLKVAEQLAAESADNAAVQVVAGTVLQASGKSEEALALLAQHQGSLEAVALIVQIHLQQNRNDLAIKEVQAARRWAQDSLLVNLAESWGGEKYQQAFYVFEELAQAPATSSTQSLVSQAVAEIHLGRLEEAEAALQQALAKDPKDADAMVNNIVLNVIAGKDSQELRSTLSAVTQEHHFLQDLEEKSGLFDKAATKYSAKVAA
ncbi:uncharacterized protein BP5553_03283 [Venustampulla echinocandica]|uniref:Uncharacterized protein n=1 Tax=Venustampulla echinocandica TaxID=2656787 RepID=A0A370TTU7_9HELO|nr:uncharacterized protein BP5553_03283 [Venustampulla echinocandica]RDL38943.1 hypothetical protein BP5553_03283 [Venustampulla echinocandica]